MSYRATYSYTLERTTMAQKEEHSSRKSQAKSKPFHGRKQFDFRLNSHASQQEQAHCVVSTQQRPACTNGSKRRNSVKQNKNLRIRFNPTSSPCRCETHGMTVTTQSCKHIPATISKNVMPPSRDSHISILGFTFVRKRCPTVLFA